MNRNLTALLLRAPIAEELQEHLSKSFIDLPSAIADRVRQAFKGILEDRRDADLIWNEITPEQRSRIAKNADESAVMLCRLAREDEEKFKEGRYNLSEAAKLIASSGETNEELMLAKLANAAGNDSLPTYMPGDKAKNEYKTKIGRFKTFDTFYDECYWDELNKWLDDNEPRIAYRFEAPAPTPNNSDDKSMQDKYRSPQGIKKQQVIIAFKDLHFNVEQWSNALADGKRAPWLLKCRTQKGTKSKNVPALWNPVQVAIALADIERAVPLKKLDAVFVAHAFLGAWQNAWTDQSTWLR
jgi:hypothetical protein